MDSILTTGSRMSRSFRNARFRLWRRFKLRGRWPMPEDFDRMTPDQFDRFVRSIGLDEQIEAAMAEYRGAQHQSRVGAGVLATSASDLDRRDPPSS